MVKLRLCRFTSRSHCEAGQRPLSKGSKACSRQRGLPPQIQMEATHQSRFDDTTAQLKARDVLEKAFNPNPAEPNYVVALNLLPRTRPGCSRCMPTPCTWGWICAVVFTSCCKGTWQAALTKRSRRGRQRPPHRAA